ncbi:hypothetical protein [Paraclostridium bifermentans]|uniref:hypothetical protein n=1 Tax=Paraclostridium bifermentans TaxID=1490 RepID=UPI0022E952DD|nr:hypothetical protein [Paraclostridium bifermentans]
MFAIDFTKPYLYKDVVYFHQGNLSTNNTLRCTLNTGGSNDLTGCNIICTFKLQNSTEISGAGRIIDPLNAIVDLVFPSNALAVGLNKLEILVNRSDGSVAQSPSITYDIWQGLTTGNGIEAETNYPILIELINSTNEASNKANSALNKANSMITDITDAIDNAYRSANEADIATSNANTKIEEVETAKTEMIKKVDTSIVTMKSEVETAKNEMASKADEKIADVDRALAAGTVDLELKEARKDASGVIHDTIKQRLDSDLIVGDKSLKDFVIDMNGMKESQDLAYETNNSYQVCTDTQSGVVKDLKVYGRTMINLSKRKITNFEGRIINVFYDDKKPLNDFTLSCHVNKNMTKKGVLMLTVDINDKVTYHDIIKAGFVGYFCRYVNTGVPIKEISIYLQTDDYVMDSAIIDNILILNGDESQNPPNGYFEGVSSFGNGNAIEVSTSKYDGNLFEMSIKEMFDSGNFIYATPYFYFPINNIIRGVEYQVKIIAKDLPMYSYSNISRISKYNPEYQTNCTVTSGNHIQNIDKILNVESRTINQDTDNDTLYVTYTIDNVSKSVVEDYIKSGKLDFKLFKKGGSDKGYSKQDKKPILYKDANGAWNHVTELKGIDNGTCDIVEENENGSIYHKKLNQEVLTSSHSFATNIELSSDGLMCRISVRVDKYIYKDYTLDLLCDKFNVISQDKLNQWIPYTICPDGWNQHVHITVPISELTTADTEGAKKYIDKVKPTVVYPRSTPLKFEANPIYPDSFDGATLVIIKGGPLPIKASFKVTSSLPNFVKELSNQIKQLQDQVYKTNVANFTVALNTLDTKLRLDRLEAPQM